MQKKENGEALEEHKKARLEDKSEYSSYCLIQVNTPSRLTGHLGMGVNSRQGTYVYWKDAMETELTSRAETPRQPTQAKSSRKAPSQYVSHLTPLLSFFHLKERDGSWSS